MSEKREDGPKEDDDDAHHHAHTTPTQDATVRGHMCWTLHILVELEIMYR